MRAALLGLALAGLALGALTGPSAASDATTEAIEALKVALKADDPAARGRGLREVGRRLAHLPDPGRRKAAVALRKALDDDPAGLVRVEAVRVLSALRDETAWVPVLRAALADRDPDVARAARRAVLTARSDVVPVVARLVKEDEDPAFRADLLLLLGARRRPDAVALLVELVGNAHPRVAAAAAEALEAISGEGLGYDVAAWRAWAARTKPAPAPATGPTVTVETVDDPEPPPPPPPARSLVPDFFGLPLDAKDLVFVIDVSGSVGETGFSKAKTELLDAAERLASDVRFGALFFDDQVRMWRPDLVRATPAAKGELAFFLRGVARGKRTDVMAALNAGLQILRTRAAERRAAKEPGVTTPVTMIVVSDGVSTVKGTPAEVVGDKLDRLDLRDTVIHVVVLGGRDSALLALLARRTGGRYVLAP